MSNLSKLCKFSSTYGNDVVAYSVDGKVKYTRIACLDCRSGVVYRKDEDGILHHPEDNCIIVNENFMINKDEINEIEKMVWRFESYFGGHIKSQTDCAFNGCSVIIQQTTLGVLLKIFRGKDVLLNENVQSIDDGKEKARVFFRDKKHQIVPIWLKISPVKEYYEASHGEYYFSIEALYGQALWNLTVYKKIDGAWSFISKMTLSELKSCQDLVQNRFCLR